MKLFNIQSSPASTIGQLEQFLKRYKKATTNLHHGCCSDNCTTMLKRPFLVTIFATVYLLAYAVMLQLNILSNVTAMLFFLSPLLLATLAYSIIRYGTYGGPELKDDEQWGYQDRQPK